MPSAVTWSYKSSLRYLFHSLKDLANPSVLPLPYLNAHLPELAVAAARLAVLETEELTQCLFPQSFLKGIKKKGVVYPSLGSVDMPSVFKDLHPFSGSCNRVSGPRIHVFFFCALRRSAFQLCHSVI